MSPARAPVSVAALGHAGVMAAFFRFHLPRWWPAARELLALTVSQPGAFSRTSRLRRYELLLRLRNGKKQRVVVRGNAVDPETYQIFSMVYRSRPRLFQAPRPLWYDHHLGYLLYVAVPGESLRNFAWSQSAAVNLTRRVGRALAEFQNLSGRRLRRLGWAAEQRLSRKTWRQIVVADRTSAQPLRPAFELYQRRLRTVWNTLPRFSHNDFQASNIILDHRRLGIIDYTMSGVGHPAIDAGIFCAHLHVMLYNQVSIAQQRRLRQAFLRGHRSGYTAAAARQIAQDLSVFEMRSCFDILRTTLLSLGPRHPAGKKYIALLSQRLQELARELS